MTHYYTDVHIRDANGTPLVSDYRWNALQINNLPPSTVTPNSPRTLSVWLQNTGTTTWTAGSGFPEPQHVLSYRIYQGQRCVANCFADRNQTLSRDMPPGDDATLNLGVYFPADLYGLVTVRLDMLQLADTLASIAESDGQKQEPRQMAPLAPVDFWFAEYGLGWYTQDVRVCVGQCVTYLPSILHQ